jgi:uncharacterized membrane protein YhaH (DUF805 family)
MSKYSFPYVALAIGIFFMLVVMIGGEVSDSQSTKLPLLTLLVISEFAFFVCVIGAYTSVRRILELGFSVIYALICVSCVLLAIRFLMLGLEFWPL